MRSFPETDIDPEFLIPYANGNLALGGYFNCTVSTLDNKVVGRLTAKMVLSMSQNTY